MDHLRSGVRDQPGQHVETLSLLKIQKLAGVVARTCNPSYWGGWGRRIAWTWEAEVAVSRDHALHSNLGNRARLCQKEKKEKKRRNAKGISIECTIFMGEALKAAYMTSNNFWIIFGQYSTIFKSYTHSLICLFWFAVLAACWWVSLRRPGLLGSFPVSSQVTTCCAERSCFWHFTAVKYNLQKK